MKFHNMILMALLILAAAALPQAKGSRRLQQGQACTRNGGEQPFYLCHRRGKVDRLVRDPRRCGSKQAQCVNNNSAGTEGPPGPPGLLGFTQENRTVNIPASTVLQTFIEFAPCGRGRVVTGGGFLVSGPCPLNSQVVQSYPDTTRSWRVTVNFQPCVSPRQLMTYALCANEPSP